MKYRRQIVVHPSPILMFGFDRFEPLVDVPAMKMCERVDFDPIGSLRPHDVNPVGVLLHGMNSDFEKSGLGILLGFLADYFEHDTPSRKRRGEDAHFLFKRNRFQLQAGNGIV